MQAAVLGVHGRQVQALHQDRPLAPDLQEKGCGDEGRLVPNIPDEIPYTLYRPQNVKSGHQRDADPTYCNLLCISSLAWECITIFC